MLLLALLTGCGPTYADAYTDVVFDDVRIHSQGDVDVHQADRELDFRDGPFSSVMLTVELRSTCFPFEQWDDDPPPSGHRWPASCDAFDRSYEIYLDPPSADGGPPAFELLHAATPFGGPLTSEVDITDLANAHPGLHTVRAFISTSSDGNGQVSGSDGGWNVSITLDAVPGPPPRNVLATIPLSRGLYGPADSDVELPFATPEGTTELRVDYRASGHGGGDADGACIGPAEEFCNRRHHVRADGAEFDDFFAWRDDCDQLCTVTSGGPFGEYCAENPCGSQASVRAPRANWCPGSVTEPFEFAESAWATPGEHSFGYTIDNVAEGGNWRVSAVAYAYGAAE